MQLRNQKDTVELTVEELKREVYPDNLDMPYSWPAQVGERVWIKVNMKWRRGIVLEDQGHAWTDRVCLTVPFLFFNPFTEICCII